MITRRALCATPLLLAASGAIAETTDSITLRPVDRATDERIVALARQLTSTGVPVSLGPGYGPLRNVASLLEHRDAEVAVLPADVVLYLRRLNRGDAAGRLRYIARFANIPVQILARQPITSLTQLSGQTVGFGPNDSVSYSTAVELFNLLQLPVKPFAGDTAQSLQMLRRGELAALVYVGDVPARLFFDLNRQQDRLGFLPIPPAAALARTYLPAQLEIQDYPLLIGEGEAGSGSPVPTIAVPMLLAVYDWPVDTDEYRRLSRFAVAFTRMSSPGPEVRDWIRFVPNLGAPKPVARAPNPAQQLTPQQREALFREFEKSQQQQ